MNKDFKCDKVLLISNMKYFEKYLSDSKSLDDIDISVHCDIGIFDWLMCFIHRKEPVIEIKNSDLFCEKLNVRQDQDTGQVFLMYVTW